MAGANLVATLRRQLLARGFTRLPVCRGCGQERSVNAFGKSGVCLPCEASIAAAEIQCAKAALHQVEERLHEVWCAAREATDPITAERLDLEQMELEGERAELLIILDPESFK